jgi:hypothetical protein
LIPMDASQTGRSIGDSHVSARWHYDRRFGDLAGRRTPHYGRVCLGSFEMNEITTLSAVFVSGRQMTSESYRVQLLSAITKLNTTDLVLLAILLVQGAHTKQWRRKNHDKEDTEGRDRRSQANRADDPKIWRHAQRSLCASRLESLQTLFDQGVCCEFHSLEKIARAGWCGQIFWIQTSSADLSTAGT